MKTTSNRLHNKVAIVTGAASGVGLATTALFIEEGAKVLAVDRPEADLDKLQAIENKDKLFILKKDITDTDAPQTITSAANENFGQIDILVNNAATLLLYPAEAFDRELWDITLEVNVSAGMALTAAAIPMLKKSAAGRIVNISSVQAQRAAPHLTAYCASKAAVSSLTRVLALELGEFGITANFIEPGATDTAMVAEALAAPGMRELWEEKSPLKRIGQPIDIAYGALFLASEESSYITGHGLRIDGGAMLSV